MIFPPWWGPVMDGQAKDSHERWMQGPSNALGIDVDLDALHVRLHAMSDAELLAFGKKMHELVYPLTYDGDGKPSVSAFSIQLEEARAEWRRRNPKNA